MRVYPKVPRYDHPTVDESVYAANDLTVLEKLDGSNFRLTVYEKQFQDEYNIPTDRSFQDGDVIFGSKKTVRGCVGDDIDTIDGSFHRAVNYLRDNLDKQAFQQIQSKLGPVTVYAENMVPHTLDYEYESNPPPALLAFDVYASRDGPESIPSDPFEDDFTGFLRLEHAWDIIRSIGLTPVPVLEGPGALNINPEEYTVPQSHYTSGQAEGIVIRTDKRKRRVKLVTEEFEELNKKRWGKHEADAEDGSELAIVRLCSDARIRKILTKLVQEDGLDPSSEDFVETLSRHTYADMWAEEWHELKTFNEEIYPPKMKRLVTSRCQELYDRDRKTASLNNVPLTNVWETARESSTKQVRSDTENRTVSPVSKEQPILETYVTDNFLSEIAESVSEEQQIQKSMINDIYTEAYDELWRRHWEDFCHLDAKFTPSEVRHRLAQRTAKFVTEQVE